MPAGEGWIGPFNLTAFCNQRAWYVEDIRPYAAWDLMHDGWAVVPPHLPEHTIADFSPAVIAHARAVAAEARAILRMDEPLRTREATALWNHVHEHRCQAFSPEGTGWDDPGNVDEKYLAYHPHRLLQKIKDLALGVKTAGLNGPLPELEYIHQEQRNGIHRLHALLPGHSHPDNAGRDMRPGVMSWDGNSGKIGWISILPDWRRRGIASEMFRRAQEITPHLRHGDLSPDAEQWVAGMATPKGSVHQAMLGPEAAPHSSLFIGERAAGHMIRQEEEAVSVPVDLTDKVGRSEGVQLHRSPASDLDLDVRPRGVFDRVIPQAPAVGTGGEGDFVRYENGFSPVNNGHVASVDANVQARAFACADPFEPDGPFPVDQPGQPRQIGVISHTGIIHNTYLRNPYHGNPMFGGNPEWAWTWFHGTRGEPDFGTRRKYSEEAQRAALPPEQRVMNSGWTQPNQHLGVHFSPLHEVGHKFAPSTWRGPTSIAHVRLRGSNPAHFETEEHLNIAMADWASRHYPHWHNEKLNSNAAWNYSDQEGTHRDFSQVPDDPGQRWRMSERAQSLLQFHPHMPEILAGFKAHLREQGHHGITYGNGVEGPYDTDATRGGEASMKAIRKHENWPRGAPKSISAIADPEDIEITHVEHISPWRAEPEGNQRTWEDVSDSDEPDEMRDRVLKWHREQGGKLPSRVGSRDDQLAAMDPLTRASALAQEMVRSRHPLVTRPLHVRDGQSSVVLTTWLARHGHPLARTAYIIGQPGTDYSCTGRGPDGEPVVALHRDRRDYGGLAHEVAHLIDDHETGRAHRAPHGPDGAHNDGWARHYATLLNSLSAGAGDEFLAEREYELSVMRHEASADPGTSQRPKRAPGSAMVYLDVPHGVVQQHEGQEAGHHIALAYLPRKIGDEAFGRVVNRAREVAARHAPMKATISGGMIFPPGTPPDRRRASVVPVHASGIHELHAEFADFDRAHYETYTPHVTRAQLGGHQADPEPHPEVSFPVTHLHVRRGDEVHSFPLTGPNRLEAAVDRGANWVDDARKTISDMAAAKGHSLTWTADEIDERRPHRMYWWRASCDNCGEPSGRSPQQVKKEVVLPQDPAENADHWLGDNENLPHWVTVKCSQGRPRKDPGARARWPRELREKQDASEAEATAKREYWQQRRQAATGYTGLTGRTAMIYLELPPGTVRPVPGGVDDHHITLVYLGKNVSDEKWEQACRRVREAASQCPPMDGVLAGIDIFPPSESSDGKVPAFVPAYIGGIGKLRRLLEDLSASEHKDYKPHVSLAYLEEGDSLPAPHPAVFLRFTHLCVKRGDDVVRFPLTGP